MNPTDFPKSIRQAKKYVLAGRITLIYIIALLVIGYIVKDDALAFDLATGFFIVGSLIGFLATCIMYPGPQAMKDYLRNIG